MTYEDQFPTTPGPLSASSPLFAKLELLKLNDIFKQQVSIFIYKCLNISSSENFKEWFKFYHSIHNYNTRHNYSGPSKQVANSLFIPFARTSNYGLKMLKVNRPMYVR